MPRDQVTRDRGQVGVQLGGPVDGPPHRALAAGGEAEVEVGEMGDPQAVKLRRQPLERALESLEPHPARFEVPPREQGGRDRQRPDHDRGNHLRTQGRRQMPRD